MTSMLDLINELWFLKRDIVSEDFDRALFRLAEEAPMQIHTYPTGETCWTWRVPEKWTCQEAYLETLDGQRLLDYAEHPLHVVSYSLPFEGEVGRAELLEHLHVHPWHPEAIPYVFKYYERDWGLCASQKTRDSLKDDVYRVVIRSRFEAGTLKVGEIVIPGRSDQTFVLAAHLCHPAMVNDDLSGVVVGLEVARTLLAGPQPYYTYRILILPETIGSVAYLSHNENLIPQMRGGLFLDKAIWAHTAQSSTMTNANSTLLGCVCRCYRFREWSRPSPPVSRPIPNTIPAWIHQQSSRRNVWRPRKPSFSDCSRPGRTTCIL